MTWQNLTFFRHKRIVQLFKYMYLDKQTLTNIQTQNRNEKMRRVYTVPDTQRIL